MISVKINASKIDKAHLYEGKNGKYLDLLMVENKGGADQYGHDGFVTQSVSREARERGEKGPIIGNWRRIQTKNSAPKPAKQTKLETPDDDDVPF